MWHCLEVLDKMKESKENGKQTSHKVLFGEKSFGVHREKYITVIQIVFQFGSRGYFGKKLIFVERGKIFRKISYNFFSKSTEMTSIENPLK